MTLIGIEPLFGLDPAMREGTRAVGPFTALWYIVFVIPFFLWVPETGVRRSSQAKGAYGQGSARSGTHASRAAAATRACSPISARRCSTATRSQRHLHLRRHLCGGRARLVDHPDRHLRHSLPRSSGRSAAGWGGRGDRRYGPKPVIVISILALIAVCTVIVTTDRTMVLLIAGRRRNPACRTSSSTSAVRRSALPAVRFRQPPAP